MGLDGLELHLKWIALDLLQYGERRLVLKRLELLQVSLLVLLI
jgi:hypothetical protein